MSDHDPELRGGLAEPETKKRARLVSNPDDLQKFTHIRETDARTALARGLKHYLETGSIDWFDGQTLKFLKVKQSWATPEEPAEFPSAAVVTPTEADYDADRFTPVLERLDEDLYDNPNFFLRRASELVQEFELHVWATSANERAGLVAMVEDMMEPVDFMTGFRLELPFYFNSRATYEKLRIVYDDSEADAQRRWRRAIISLTGSLTQLVPVGSIPIMKPRVPVEVEVAEGNC